MSLSYASRAFIFGIYICINKMVQLEVVGFGLMMIFIMIKCLTSFIELFVIRLFYKMFTVITGLIK